jgi:hypothetical protein
VRHLFLRKRAVAVNCTAPRFATGAMRLSQGRKHTRDALSHLGMCDDDLCVCFSVKNSHSAVERGMPLKRWRYANRKRCVNTKKGPGHRG